MNYATRKEQQMKTESNYAINFNYFYNYNLLYYIHNHIYNQNYNQNYNYPLNQFKNYISTRIPTKKVKKTRTKKKKQEQGKRRYKTEHEIIIIQTEIILMQFSNEKYYQFQENSNKKGCYFKQNKKLELITTPRTLLNLDSLSWSRREKIFKHISGYKYKRLVNIGRNKTVTRTSQGKLRSRQPNAQAHKYRPYLFPIKKAILRKVTLRYLVLKTFYSSATTGVPTAYTTKTPTQSRSAAAPPPPGWSRNPSPRNSPSSPRTQRSSSSSRRPSVLPATTHVNGFGFVLRPP